MMDAFQQPKMRTDDFIVFALFLIVEFRFNRSDKQRTHYVAGIFIIIYNFFYSFGNRQIHFVFMCKSNMASVV